MVAGPGRTREAAGSDGAEAEGSNSLERPNAAASRSLSARQALGGGRLVVGRWH